MNYYRGANKISNEKNKKKIRAIIPYLSVFTLSYTLLYYALSVQVYRYYVIM